MSELRLFMEGEQVASCECVFGDAVRILLSTSWQGESNTTALKPSDIVRLMLVASWVGYMHKVMLRL